MTSPLHTFWDDEDDGPETYGQADVYHPFAGCDHPDCEATPASTLDDEVGYINVGRRHYGVCHAHKVIWLIGDNLFSSWRDQTVDDWKAQVRGVEGYRIAGGSPGAVVNTQGIDEWPVWRDYEWSAD